MGTANVTLYAEWTINQYTISASAGSGGTINPSGPVTVNYGGNQGFTITVNTGYTILSVTVDGVNKGAIGSYTFSNVTANHSISASFIPTYTVTYNGNQNTLGSVPVDSTQYTNGQTATVLSNTGNLWKTCYYFRGWNTSASGSGTTNVPGQTLVMGSANVTLYAVWGVPIINTFAGNGTGGFSGDNGPATNAEINQTRGITIDSTGNLYIADYANYRIREVTNGIIFTIAGNGIEGFSGDNGIATSAELNDPHDVALDKNGNLYIADRNNNRIREV
jgi:hypothetical protein